MKVAVLDDYQNVAASCADWDSLGCDVTFINRHLGSAPQVVAALQGFEVAVAMRERTVFDASVLANVPSLRYWSQRACAMQRSMLAQQATTASRCVGRGRPAMPQQNSRLHSSRSSPGD